MRRDETFRRRNMYNTHKYMRNGLRLYTPEYSTGIMGRAGGWGTGESGVNMRTKFTLQTKSEASAGNWSAFGRGCCQMLQNVFSERLCRYMIVIQLNYIYIYIYIYIYLHENSEETFEIYSSAILYKYISPLGNITTSFTGKQPQAV